MRIWNVFKASISSLPSPTNYNCNNNWATYVRNSADNVRKWTTTLLLSNSFSYVWKATLLNICDKVINLPNLLFIDHRSLWKENRLILYQFQWRLEWNNREKISTTLKFVDDNQNEACGYIDVFVYLYVE